MTFSTSANLLTNGTFTDGLTGWTAIDADDTVASIVARDNAVNLNAGQDTVFGDALEQEFATTAGQDLTMVIQLNTFQGDGRHSFLIELFDDAGNLIQSTAAQTQPDTNDFVSLNFTALSATTTIKITNTDTTNTINSDARIVNVGVFDLDTIDVFELTGGSGGNRFQGTDADDFFVGDGRGDTFFGSLGADTLDGSSGADLVDYSASTEAVNLFGRGTTNEVASTGGLAEGDVLRNIERVIGTDFDDVFNIRTNKTTIDAGAGDDLIIGSFNSDVFIGGAGNDTIFGDNGADRAIFTGDLGDFDFSTDGTRLLVINRVTGEIDTLGGIENLTFDDGTFATVDLAPTEPLNTVITGSGTVDGTGLGDDITGGDANDTISGFGGNDTILARDGADEIHGGFGDDDINGVRGNDLIFGDAGNDTILGGKGKDTIDGGDGDDVILGGRGRNKVNGADGDDLIIGDSSIDRLTGGFGDDTLEGGAGEDRLAGSRGKDVLDGGAGDDRMSGGKGVDTFVFADGFGTDVIEDFEVDVSGEVIDLSGVTSITSFADLIDNHITANSDHLLIDDGAGNTIRLNGLDQSDLDALTTDQFIFALV